MTTQESNQLGVLVTTLISIGFTTLSRNQSEKGISNFTFSNEGHFDQSKIEVKIKIPTRLGYRIHKSIIKWAMNEIGELEKCENRIFQDKDF